MIMKTMMVMTTMILMTTIMTMMINLCALWSEDRGTRLYCVHTEYRERYTIMVDSMVRL